MKVFYILTQYYPPETGAPQNRLQGLALFLQSKGHRVKVFTAMPNYPLNAVYPGYRNKLFTKEEIGGVLVYRSWIFVPSARSVPARLLNYFSFVLTSFFRLLLKSRPDYLFCESPPLFLGITAVCIAKIKCTKLLFNVSDLWPESAEKLGIVRNRLLLKISYHLEHWIYRNAHVISGQTKGIVNSISTRFPQKKIVWMPNGADSELFDFNVTTLNWREKWNCASDTLVLLYAGIFGHAQGLPVILDVAGRLLNYPIKFVLVGDGPERLFLENQVKKRELVNVVLYPPVARTTVLSMIKACDIYWVPLKKLDLFKGAIPSKIFEPMALGKPVLLGVEGEACELFIKDGKAGIACEPENAIDMTEKIIWLFEHPEERITMGKNGRDYVLKFFDRRKIHQRWLHEVLAC